MRGWSGDQLPQALALIYSVRYHTHRLPAGHPCARNMDDRMQQEKRGPRGPPARCAEDANVWRKSNEIMVLASILVALGDGV
jgi:hypothetical protein